MDLQLLSQCGSTYNCLSRLVTEKHFAFCWEVKQPRHKLQLLVELKIHLTLFQISTSLSCDLFVCLFCFALFSFFLLLLFVAFVVIFWGIILVHRISCVLVLQIALW